MKAVSPSAIATANVVRFARYRVETAKASKALVYERGNVR
jgi:hypothetical protein